MRKVFSIISIMICPLLYGQIFSNDIATNNPNNDDPYTVGQIVDPNIVVSGIGRGPTINGNNGNDRYNGRDWNLSAFDLGDYYYFTLTPNAGYEIDFTNLVFNSERSNTGPVQIAVRSSLDGFTANIGMPVMGGTGVVTQSIIDLSSINYQNITSAISFRVYAWGGTNTNGTFSVNDFIFNGTVSQSCGSTVTWDGSSWVGGSPNINREVIIDGNYSTSISGSFSACSLTINSGILTIDNDNYVEVQNDLVANGNIIVRPQGAFVQIDDLATVNGTGNITVEKETAPANNWYEYTYWSSPVSTETILDGLSDAELGRVFSFNAQNYLDATTETNNDNSSLLGQDGIDDDGNDWQVVSGSAIMTPGVGYASTHNRVIFESSPGPLPRQFVYTFDGLFNTGVINVPLYRNDSETNDINWNFIGNPYPSAINADLFLSTNTDVDGAIYLWSQNTPPSSSANGNEPLNFSDSDYAVINLAGEVAGGDGITPNRFIPSGQGFFVSYSDVAVPISTSGNISEGSVTFNNSLRVRGATNNSQFFKSSNPEKSSNINYNLDNKLWLNLTSDNGVFNQVMIGYIEGATNLDDGAKYDSQKLIAAVRSAILYTTIKNSNRKFAIQGNNSKDLTRGEKIKLGFDTAINVPTLYKLSIEKLQGSFLSENDVFLKDKYLKKVHNLSLSAYTFTSEIGEFKDRFEIVFKENKPYLNNDVKLSKLNNTAVRFSVDNNTSIKSISIFDFLGNTVYYLKGDSSSEVYNLPKLKNALYVAKIELSNGELVTKKFVKD